MLITDLRLQTYVPSEQVDCSNAQFPESDMPLYRKLGRTDLTVSCLGLGGGGSISSEDTLYAFDQGINYFFTPATCTIIYIVQWLEHCARCVDVVP